MLLFYAGKVRRVTGVRTLFKLKDYKKVYVRLADVEATAPKSSGESASSSLR